MTVISIYFISLVGSTLRDAWLAIMLVTASRQTKEEVNYLHTPSVLVISYQLCEILPDFLLILPSQNSDTPSNLAEKCGGKEER